MPSLAQRFWSKVDKSSTNPKGCWLWTAGKSAAGYGKFGFEGLTRGAHRVAWRLTHGAFPSLHVLHKCDTPACVRPAHLFLGTDADNGADMRAKGRQASPERHASPGARNGRAKLTATAVRWIRDTDARPTTHVARAFGVSESLIRQIRRRAVWKHIS